MGYCARSVKIRTCLASPHRLTWSVGWKTQQQMAINSTDVAVVDRYVLDDCHCHTGTLWQRCGTLILLEFSVNERALLFALKPGVKAELN